jgi:hypothetical protein
MNKTQFTINPLSAEFESGSTVFAIITDSSYQDRRDHKNNKLAPLKKGVRIHRSPSLLWEISNV